MMKRDECFRVLARHVTDEVLVSTYSSAVDWLNLGERTLNYFSVGAMGLDSSHALGLALGRPNKRIICMQGDGSLLMNLGCLVTIAAAAPKNLVHIVVQNGTYEANGGHPIPNTEVEFAAMARAAGYAHVHHFSQLANFEQQAAHVLKQDGPVFATLHVEPTKPLTYDYPNLYDPARRKALKAALQSSSSKRNDAPRLRVCAKPADDRLQRPLPRKRGRDRVGARKKIRASLPPPQPSPASGRGGTPHPRNRRRPITQRRKLEHDPEKWIPVFGKDHAPTKG